MITKLIFSGTSLTLTFDTGDLYFGNCTLEQAKHLASNENLTLEEVTIYLEPAYAKTIEENKEGKKTIEIVITDDRFYYAEGSLYRVGIPLSIPKHLAEDIAECLTNIQKANAELDDVNAAYWSDSLETLDNFWKWTSLIRTPESRESFYTYCQKNTLLITKQGFVVAFRRANHVGRDNSLAKFVTQEYLRLRTNKKSTAVEVYKWEDGVYSTKLPNKDEYKVEEMGILKDLYLSLGDEETERFESITFGKDGKSLQYIIGKETRLAESEADFSNAECSAGIHISHGGYRFNGYGDSALAVVFNPLDTVHCPYSDHQKMRVLAITPIAVLEKDCEFELTPEIGAMIDEMFVNHVNNLQEMLEKGDFKEFSKHKLVKDLHFTSILNTIVSENKELVKNRYVKL